MRDRKTIFLLILIMAVVSLITTGIAIYELYRAAFSEQRARLVETVQSQARLIEAVARFDASHSELDHPGGAAGTTLSQITDAHDRYTASGDTGEFALAQRDGDDMVFLLRHRHGDLDNPAPVPFDSELAEPMRRALSGESGTVIGLDYRGESVLAAYEPVADLDWGIVAKIDLSEVRSPFIRAGFLSCAIGFLVVLLGSALFVQVSRPLVRRVRASEERYRAVFEQAGDTIVVIDGKTGGIVEFNDRAHENLGYSREEFAKLKIADFDAAESAEEVEAHVRRIVEEGVDTFDTQHRTKYGEIRDIRVSTRLLDIPGQTLFASIWRDITERKQAEEALQESEERFRRLSDASFEAIVIHEDGVVIDANEACARLFGYDRSEVPGMMAADVFPEGSLESVLENMQQGSEKPFESIARRSDGTEFPVEITGRTMPHMGRSVRVVAVRDITERKQAEEALRLSEQKYRGLFDTMAQGVVYQDVEGRILSTNASAERILGLTMEEMQGRRSADPRWKTIREDGSEFPPEMHPSMVALETGKHVRGVIMGVFNSREQRHRWILIDAVPEFRAGEDRPYRAYTTFADVTDRREAQQALQESRQMLKLILDSIPVRVFWKDRDSVYVGCNRHFAEDGGLGSPEEIIGQTDFDMGWRDQAELYRADDAEVIRTGVSKLNYEEPQTRPDGAEVWLQTSKIPLRDVEGNVVGVLGCYEDITERKHAEEELRRTRFAVDHAVDAVYWIDQDGRFFDVNEAACRKLGCSREELLQMSVFDIDPDYTPQAWADVLPELRENRSLTIETRHRAKDGDTFPVEIAANHLQFAGREFICSFARDITDRKRAAEALRESEQRYRAIVEDQAEFIVRWLPDGTRTFVNEAYCRYFGRTLEDVVGESFFPVVSEQERAAVQRKIATLSPEQPAVTDEHQLIRPDGTTGWHQWTDRGIFDEHGRLVELQSVGRDVTDRRLAEDALREREELYTNIVESMSDGIIVLDREYNCIYWNRAMERLGKMTREELIADGRVIWEIFPHLVEQEVDEMMKQAMAGERAERAEIPFRLLDGTAGFTDETYLPLRTADGEISGIVGVIHDITDRKRADRALRESEERYRITFEQAAVGICHVSLDGRFQRVNRHVCEIWGYAPEELRKMTYRDLTVPEDLERDMEAMRRLLAGEMETFAREKQYIRKDGSVVWVALTVSVVRGAAGEPLYSIAVVEDISDRRRAEEALRDREARLRLMFKQMPAVVWTVDGDLRFTSSQGLGLQQLKLHPDQAVGVSLHEYFQTDDENFPAIVAHRRALNGMSVAYETHWEGRVFQSHVEPLRGPTGRTIGCIGASLDVTEHKAAEAEARARAEAERLLLRELDHRVRNNLASLISLIDLTAGSARDVEQFGGAIRARVQAMATVHALLSRSHWEPVRLQALLGAPVPSGCRGVIRLEGPEIGLPATQAQAMGMVLNELMANSLKYGALSSADGAADVTWDEASDHADRRVLILHWNETGGPPVEAEPTPGVGVGLIRGLVAYELRGRAELGFPRDGARHRFEFALDESPPGGK